MAPPIPATAGSLFYSVLGVAVGGVILAGALLKRNFQTALQHQYDMSSVTLENWNETHSVTPTELVTPDTELQVTK